MNSKNPISLSGNGEKMSKGKNSDSKVKKQDSFESTLWQAADKLRKNMMPQN